MLDDLIAIEREECAKVAEEYGSHYCHEEDGEWAAAHVEAAERIAAAIRARTRAVTAF